MITYTQNKYNKISRKNQSFRTGVIYLDSGQYCCCKFQVCSERNIVHDDRGLRFIWRSGDIPYAIIWRKILFIIFLRYLLVSLEVTIVQNYIVPLATGPTHSNHPDSQHSVSFTMYSHQSKKYFKKIRLAAILQDSFMYVNMSMPVIVTKCRTLFAHFMK